MLLVSNYLVSKLKSFDKNNIIALESTAHYNDNLAQYLVAEFYQVCVEPNPNLSAAQK